MGKDKFTFILAIAVVQMAQDEYALAQKTFLMENQVNLASSAFEGDMMWPKYTLTEEQAFEHQFNFQDHPANHALCVPLNNEEFRRLVQLRSSLVAGGERFLVDPAGRQDIEYCNRVLSQFLEWYDRWEMDIPNDCMRLIVPPIEQKERWTGTKKQFAIHVNDQYEQNRQKYPNLRVASDELFEQYSFDDPLWTKKRCYDYVRK